MPIDTFIDAFVTLLFCSTPADQEKAIVYNELVANAVALQNVVDQTQALHALKTKGVEGVRSFV